MSDTVIKAEHLSKSYLLGHRQKGRERYATLRDVIMREARQFGRKGIDLARGRQIVQGDEVEELWALKDVSFEVKQGEVLGIIGRNGAGKSTLLKILSRITEPTKGRVLLQGRVSSLLEVGTGFHPELTGRENIFLNGAILGMTQREIRKKFDEIVAFAEIEKFLDMPVKRYSSGMYVRLAFAVAAHLEPEILVVDEVLAVGDIEFQKKCIGKMSNVAKEGRTILFVSHNLRAVQALCSSGILLNNGLVMARGSVLKCTELYLKAQDLPESGYADLRVANGLYRRGSGKCRFQSFELLNAEGARAGSFAFGEAFRVRINVESKVPLRDVTLGFSFVTEDGLELMGTGVNDDGVACGLDVGPKSLQCNVSPMILTPGRYFLRAAIFTSTEELDYIDEILSFEVLNAAADNAEVPMAYVGNVYFPYRWTTFD